MQSGPHGQLGPAPRTAQTPADLRERQPSLGCRARVAGPPWRWRLAEQPGASSSSSSVSARLFGMPRCSFRLGEFFTAPAGAHIRLWRRAAAPDHLVAQPQADPDGGKSVAMTGRLQSRRLWHPQATGSLPFSSSRPRSHDRVVPPTQAPESRFACRHRLKTDPLLLGTRPVPEGQFSPGVDIADLGACRAAHPAGRAHRRSFSRRQGTGLLDNECHPPPGCLLIDRSHGVLTRLRVLVLSQRIGRLSHRVTR